MKITAPGVSCKLENFEQFLKERNELIPAELKRLLVS